MNGTLGLAQPESAEFRTAFDTRLLEYRFAVAPNLSPGAEAAGGQAWVSG